ncbi:MAG TPA: hypothetical protein VHM67_10095 [Gemmatimonadaceae bacterium]|nr:hypothetical protein [Gemmatimonadaceae bacterium]
MMARFFVVLAGSAAVVAAAVGCERDGAAAQTAAGSRDTVPQSPPPIVPARCATMPPSWTLAVTPRHLLPEPDSVLALRDSIESEGVSPDSARADSLRRARRRQAPALDTFPTPPTPLPGSVLPGCRIVAYYGNPLSKRMGIMGALPPETMLAKLDSQAMDYERADTATPVIRALELITPVAQASPGPGNLWRTRMPDTLIEHVAKLAESKGWLLFLDVQVGKSNVAAELAPLMKYLERPYVHLALDPEFSMKGPEPPGKKIGTLDAADINVAIAQLARLVDEKKLPPKVLVVHRFTRRMVTNHERITRDPRVQVVVNMDGFGPPRLKLASYEAYVHDRPVQYYGIKLFYKNDKPIFTAKDVMRLHPIPQYIQYQ